MSASTCVVFDMDDTLYLEADYVRSGFDAVSSWMAQTRDVDGFADTAWALFEAGHRGDIFNRALAGLGLDDDDGTVMALVDVYRNHVPKIRVLDDAAECIAQLHGSTPLALVSDGPLPSQTAKVDALGLRRWLDVVVLTEELGPGRGKPHPAAFELVAERLGRPGTNFLYVADNPRKDFDAPKAMGWHCVRIRRPRGLHAHLDSGPNVDVEVSELRALLSAVSCGA